MDSENINKSLPPSTSSSPSKTSLPPLPPTSSSSSSFGSSPLSPPSVPPPNPSPSDASNASQPSSSPSVPHYTMRVRPHGITASMNDSARQSSVDPPTPSSLPAAAARTHVFQAKDRLSQNPSTGGVSVAPSGVVADESSDDVLTIRAEPSDDRYANEAVYVQVSKSDSIYNLQPIHCGRSVVFLNAQDPRFYKRELRSPSLSVWILSNMAINESHALKRLYESGWRQNIEVKVMEVNKFELVATKEGLENVLYEGNGVELPDAVFVRVGANVGYFGLAVIRQLEQIGCLMFNNLRSIEISRDKMLTLQHLSAHGLPIPKTILAKFPMNVELIKREFEYPIIIKKASGSQGKGIIKVDNHNQLLDLVDMLDTGKPLLFQEFISASSGKDLRVFVVGGRVVGAMMRIAAKGNFKANVHQGGTVKAVKLSAQVEWLVLETVRIIGLDIAGVDLLIDKNTYKICEVNSSPGFEGLERALGENIAIKMFLYMKMRLGVWRRNTKGHARLEITVPVEAEHLMLQPGDGFADNDAHANTINNRQKQKSDAPANATNQESSSTKKTSNDAKDNEEKKNDASQ